MDYKSKYEELKDQVIDNFDYWLDEEITTDMAEEKEVYTMITEYDEYLFCLGLESELKILIEKLIKDYKQEERELLVKFVGLKRVLNKRMLQNPYYNEEDIEEIHNIKREKEDKIESYIQVNSTFTNSNELLNKLHNELLRREYIECSLFAFKSIFKDTSEQSKVVWKGTILQLIGLIKLLQRKGFISRHTLTRPKIAFNFFKNKNEDFKLRSIQTTSSRVEKEKLSYEEIEELVEEIFN